jgi:hypothetical protein
LDVVGGEGGVMSRMVVVVGVVDRGGSRRLLHHERMKNWGGGVLARGENEVGEVNL